MKTAIFVAALLAMLMGFTASCEFVCTWDQPGFDQCYSLCDPASHTCVSDCVNAWYCAVWTPYCSFGYPDHWGYCD